MRGILEGSSTEEQKRAVERILKTESVSAEPKVFFLQLVRWDRNTVCRDLPVGEIRLREKIAFALPSSGIVTLLLLGIEIVHSRS
jgi:hypothetical protein